ncbi:hypothetical protein T05_6021 [Trichinella murrelli]|uniref:Uncharacterized protein n=1 Tax=Trichinella murrelli TaxID=144512 RepID=A0A0V0TMS2_9BILA|nr:hypothetical protein T05_6021 [Trichinella murrelli]
MVVVSALIVSYVVLRDGFQLKNLSQTTYRMQRMLQYYFHHIFRVTSGLRWPHPTSAWGLLRPPHHCRPETKLSISLPCLRPIAALAASEIIRCPSGRSCVSRTCPYRLHVVEPSDQGLQGLNQAISADVAGMSLFRR